MQFRDRYEAAMKLIPFLEKYKNDKGVILAVPRGGVPLGYLIAKKFKFPLELMLTKKIGHPMSGEFAIGAVGLEDYIIDENCNVSDSYLEEEIQRIRISLKERQKKFMGSRKPMNLEGKTIIVVDDGIATGYTILAAIKMLKKKHPKLIVVAVPVAPPETAKKIKKLVDDFICLYTPEDFFGVGQFYDDFSEVTDDDVLQLMAEINNVDEAA